MNEKDLTDILYGEIDLFLLLKKEMPDDYILPILKYSIESYCKEYESLTDRGFNYVMSWKRYVEHKGLKTEFNLAQPKLNFIDHDLVTESGGLKNVE
jgi:hypothetical protein